MIEYTVIRSNRKTVGIEYRDGRVILRAPLRVPESELRRIAEEKRGWIEKQIRREAARRAQLSDIAPLTPDELRALARQAVSVIPPRVAYYAELLGVTYGRITVRAQRTRWGSCSPDGNLSFNCLLMLTPAEVLDSVIVHELCHRLEMNHSPRFYAAVARVMPDYAARHAWLKEHSAALLRRSTLR